MKGQLDLMRRACGELEGCDDFVRLLQEVLQTGNRLNEGTMRGAAAGASMPTLVWRRICLPCLRELMTSGAPWINLCMLPTHSEPSGRPAENSHCVAIGQDCSLSRVLIVLYRCVNLGSVAMPRSHAEIQQQQR